MQRRTFLAMAGVGGVGLVSGCVSVPPPRVAPGSKLNHASIGVGGMGEVDLQNFMSHANLEMVAICDVDRNRLAKAAAAAPRARTYTDWRELLAQEGSRVDSVNVAVPDHMHAAITLAALKAGKHVYCQKPLCHDVAECRVVAAAARQAGVVTQLGTQHASGIGDRMTVQWLREGVVGKVKRVILCSNRPGAENYRLPGPRPTQVTPAPDTLAWDLWIGTAPERPYAPNIYHPGLWRSWQDFGTGWSGDIGCHIFDAIWKGLGLTAPRTVLAEVQDSWKLSPERRADTWPQADHITWMFPGSKLTEGKELVVEWFDGDKYPPPEAQALAKAGGFEVYPPESALVLGTEGALLMPHTSGPVLLPREKFAGTPRPKLPARSHYHHFVDACRGGEPTESHFMQTGPMAEAILLGTVAIRVPDKVLEWDARRLRITNAPEADRLLRRTYRRGWEVDLGRYGA